MINSRRSLRLPQHWIQCPAMSTSPIAERFVALKTPLDERYDPFINDESKRFKPFHVVNQTRKICRGELKAIIDLTNSRRYYNGSDFTSQNPSIEYHKIACVGHEQCPDEEQTKRFIQYCKGILEKSADAIIGVHCTHGYNRTGFLICAFLVEHMDFSLDTAVGEFRKARPPGIYKQDYIDELISRFGDEYCDIEPIQMPDWRPDNPGDGQPCQDAVQQCQMKRIRNNESEADEPAAKIAGHSTLHFGVRLEASHARPILKKIREFTGSEKYQGFPGYQAVSMDMQNIELLKSQRYMVSWKADGTRYLCFIEEKDKVYFVDRSNAIYQIPDIVFPSNADPEAHLRHTLIDGELIVDKDGNREILRYLIFDIVTLQGHPIGQRFGFDIRQNCIFQEIVHPRHKAMISGQIDKAKEPFSVRRKDFWDISTARKLLDGTFASQVSHDVDGLIFQPISKPYTVGTCLDILKWKPHCQNSVDFRLKVVKVRKMGEPVRNVGQLYTIGMREPFSTIEDARRDLAQHSGQIIECRWANSGEWEFIRVRTDKNQPNSFNTAVAICESIRNPVTKEILFSSIADCVGMTSLPE